MPLLRRAWYVPGANGDFFYLRGFTTLAVYSYRDYHRLGQITRVHVRRLPGFFSLENTKSTHSKFNNLTSIHNTIQHRSRPRTTTANFLCCWNGRYKKRLGRKMKLLGSRFLALGATVSTAAAFVAQQPRWVGPLIRTTSRSPIRSVLAMAESSSNEFLEAPPSEYDLLGLPARPGRPLKVAIAGGGVGGLTTALCMLKKGFDVQVYERTAAFARFGGPIQFASNALSVLKEIDERLFERVMEKFTFTGTRACGIKDGMSLYRCGSLVELYSLN
jgi:hypothetical protein